MKQKHKILLIENNKKRIETGNKWFSVQRNEPAQIYKKMNGKTKKWEINFLRSPTFAN